MDDDGSVLPLLRRLRAGDPEAAVEVVRRYEPLIRARVRVWLRLNHPGMIGELDSADVCQSVLGSFFVRAAAGQFDLERPEQLAGLLVKMARHKLLDQVKHRHSGRRDIRRRERIGVGRAEPEAREAGPHRLLVGRELLDRVWGRLPPEDRRVAVLRSEGRTWAEVAEALGGTAEGRRKQLARSLDTVARELEIDEDGLGG